MITNGEQWHYTALKSVCTDDGFNRPTRSLSRLFRGITVNHYGDFYCVNCLHPFRTNDYCHPEMPSKNINKLKYNHGEKIINSIIYNLC